MTIRTDAEGNPILDQFSEEGFIDCVLKIVDLSENDDRYEFGLVASFEGQRVGMNVSIVKNIKAGFGAEMNLEKDHVYRKGVWFFRSGPESDRLISALSTLYQLGSAARKMVDRESFTAIALHQGEIDMATEPIKIKIFGNDRETDSEDSYYESFFNLDLAGGLVFWNEKDPDYREPLIGSLAKRVGP